MLTFCNDRKAVSWPRGRLSRFAETNRLSSGHTACQRILRGVIYMYWNERDHPVAHFHAYHAGRRVSVSVNVEVLAGSLDARALQFVREWARPRKGEIMANWERARRNEQLLAIEPLA